MRHTYVWAILITCIVFGYGIFVGHRLLEGPTVSITQPKDGETITTRRFVLTGTSANISSVEIAGIPVLHHQDGSFSQEYHTPEGYVEIVVTAKNHFGATVSDRISIWGAPPPAPLPIVAPETARGAHGTSTENIEPLHSTSSSSTEPAPAQ